MKVAIIEDEELACERLECILNEIDASILISAKLGSVDAAVKWLRENTPDLIFLDIQLSDGLCFSIFDKIQVKPPVIFTTAYDQYAINAFKLNSVDYLLKPIRKYELSESLDKFRNMKASFLLDIEEILRSYQAKEVSYKKRFLVQFGQMIKKVETGDIAYFYAVEKNVFFTTFDNSQCPVDYSLDKLQEILDPEKFFRINRKLLINMDAIKNMVPYSRSRIRVDLTPKAPAYIEAIVSVERVSKFKDWLNL
ncbi:MAG: LytR/AlgR family response regulator transcription factor [Syntrophothermus sp.]